MIKNCVVCGKQFEDRCKPPKRKYCSKRCEAKSFYKRHKERINQKARQRRKDHPEFYKKYYSEYRQNNKNRINLGLARNRDKILVRKREYHNRNKIRDIERMKKYYAKNKDKIKSLVKQYQLSNKEKVALSKAKNYQAKKEYYLLKHGEYVKKRKLIDLKFASILRLRRRLRKALDTYSSTGKIRSADSYGVNYEKIIKHLVKNMPKNITLRELLNSKKYHIDHIRPLASFDLNNPEEIREAFKPENHRWLTAKENQAKIVSDKKLSILRRSMR